MTLDPAQTSSLIRAFMGIGGGYLIAKGLSQAQVDDITTWLVLTAGVIPVIADIVWGLIKNSMAGKVATAESIPDTKLVVGHNAPEAAIQAAVDSTRPKVVVGNI